MVQRYGLLAMSLLTISAVVIAAISIDPKGFLLKDWQPLIAAIIALGGASIVYRGATLSYNASMAKFDHDRDVYVTTQRRTERGIFLRLQFATFVMQHDAAALKTRFQWDPSKHDEASIDYITLRTIPDLEEAWSNLHAFPGDTARLFLLLKTALFNFAEAKRRMGTKPMRINALAIRDTPLSDLRDAFDQVIHACSELTKPLSELAEI